MEFNRENWTRSAIGLTQICSGKTLGTVKLGAFVMNLLHFVGLNLK